MDIDLKPCPFCGSRATKLRAEPGGGEFEQYMIFIQCETCSSRSVPFVVGAGASTKRVYEIAARRWNRSGRSIDHKKAEAPAAPGQGNRQARRNVRRPPDKTAEEGGRQDVLSGDRAGSQGENVDG